MAQTILPSTYKQGYSNYTLATHQTRTAESDAGFFFFFFFFFFFLQAHIKKTDHILDVGCGPGTITAGFGKYATEGTVRGLDISADVLERAKAFAAESHILPRDRAL